VEERGETGIRVEASFASTLSTPLSKKQGLPPEVPAHKKSHPVANASAGQRWAGKSGWQRNYGFSRRLGLQYTQAIERG
jgi:hypothetical protein